MSTATLHRTQRSSSSNAVTASSQNHLCEDSAYERRQKDINIDVIHDNGKGIKAPDEKEANGILLNLKLHSKNILRPYLF